MNHLGAAVCCGRHRCWSENRTALLHGVEVRHDISTVLLLLEARERHVGALDVLLRVLEVVEERLPGEKQTDASRAGGKRSGPVSGTDSRTQAAQWRVAGAEVCSIMPAALRRLHAI